MAVLRRKQATARKPRPIAHLPGLSSRPAWQGTLRLSLVSCAVGLYKATTKAGDVAFHLINPDTGNRIKMVPTDPDRGPIERSHLVKGFEVEKDKYVLLNEEELESVKLETTRTLNIERFVDADTIDHLYWDTPYILAPTDAAAAEAYGVIQQAMVAAKKIALGRLTMHTRERLMAIEPRDNGLLATTLRMRDEVVNSDEALAAIPRGKADKQMIAIAQQIIEQQEGPFDPEEFTDRYEDALHALIEEKRKGHTIKSVPRAPEGNVIDLMDALKRSLGNRSRAPKLAVAGKRTKRAASR
jgi:DNA end-binding protein Ku